MHIIQKQFSNIVNYYILMEENYSQIVIVSVQKYSSKQILEIAEGVFSLFEKYINIKFLIICDEDIDIRNMNDVIWAITTRLDPARDVIFFKKFSSRFCLNATNKFSDETSRKWGLPIRKDSAVVDRIDKIWAKLDC
nr:UbiD family decarboxylase domain-containing protein [Candidatus Photodesmus katoptron]